MEALVRDIRFGIRRLLKQPAFAALSILTLALAIGTNTAMFSVINEVLLRPLPYPQPERLVWMSESGDEVAKSNVRKMKPGAQWKPFALSIAQVWKSNITFLHRRGPTFPSTLELTWWSPTE